MFINRIQMTIAKQILCRIYAIRLSENMTPYDYAATIVEAYNWTSDKMQDVSDEEYNTLHKFWVFVGHKCCASRVAGFVRYAEDNLKYETVPARSAIGCIFNQIRSGK